MKKFFITTLLNAFFLAVMTAGNAPTLSIYSPVTEPLHEVRAVWLTTIGGIDWPHSYAQPYQPRSVEVQQRELCQILDRLVKANINTVIIQTRIRATTIFPSDMEPWDGCLSGKPGQSPGYDALAYAINECHKRGLKVHAWVVTIPCGKWNGAGCKNLRKTHPELLKKIGDEGFLNPENPRTADYLARFCGDLTSRYDIDGIHLDYIRYPDTWGKIGNRERGRDNITRIVRAIASEVRDIKPWVQLSCSPVGKYADTKRQWSHGWNARDAVCQDVHLWLKEGLMDAIYPMMYFKNENFYPFAIDWQERSEGRIVAPGLGIYFMHPREKNWPITDITRQLHVLRQYGMGNCMFRSKFFTDNTKGLYNYFADGFATLPALQPAMTWLNDTKPASPSYVNFTGNVVSWGEEVQGFKGSRVQDVTYNLYGSDVMPVDVSKAENLLAANLTDKQINVGNAGAIRYFAVTATDRYGNESKPSFSYATGHEETPVPSAPTMLPYSNGVVTLNGTDAAAGKLMIVTSAYGNDICSAIVSRYAGNITIRTGKLSAGLYKVYTIYKKGHRHLLGYFAVEPEKN